MLAQGNRSGRVVARRRLGHVRLDVSMHSRRAAQPQQPPLAVRHKPAQDVVQSGVGVRGEQHRAAILHKRLHTHTLTHSRPQTHTVSTPSAQGQRLEHGQAHGAYTGHAQSTTMHAGCRGALTCTIAAIVVVLPAPGRPITRT
jgi:hypothetical protein